MRTKSLLATIALAALALLSACEEGDKQLIQDFATDWAKAHHIDPNTDEGKENIGKRILSQAAANASGGLVDTYSTGDPDADAAIDAGSVVKNMQDADQLSNQALANFDAGAADKAIALRPNDPTYYNSKGIALIGNGNQPANLAAAQQAFAKADAKAQQAGTQAQILTLRNRMNDAMNVWNLLPQAPTRDDYKQQYCRDAAVYAQLTGRAPNPGFCQ